MIITRFPSPLFRSGIYGVLGHKIAYSLSPMLFRRVFAELGWPAVYGLFDMAPSQLGRFTAAAPDAGIAGFNVTQPYKMSIMRHLDHLDPSAAAVGAVNTVVVKKSKLIGYNTDLDGVFCVLRPVRSSLDGGCAVILGAGGAARAVAFTLANRFHVREISIAARSQTMGICLLQQMRSQSGPRINWRLCSFARRELNQALSHAALLINATPIGGPGRERQSPLPADTDLSGCKVVFDLVYRPRPSRLLKQAKEAGCQTTLDGWGMLIAQAEAAFTLWTGRRFPRRVRQDILAWSGTA